MARTLIICPTHDHADTLLAAIPAVLTQREKDWELVVIGDGAPPRAAEIVEGFMRRDKRIRYVAHPKGAHFGEAYRDPVIRDSDSEFICHMGDDDIWSNRHLETMQRMLADADWAMASELTIRPNGRAVWRFGNQSGDMSAKLASASPATMIAGGLNNVAVRRNAYLSLPSGWTPAKEGHPSDKTMWLKYLRNPHIRRASSAFVTYLKLTGTGERRAMSPLARLTELQPLLVKVNAPGYMDRVRASADIGFNCARALFAYEGATEAATFDGGMTAIGLQPSASDAHASVAVQGAPMRLPVTTTQLEQLETCWALARCLKQDLPFSDRVRALVLANDRIGAGVFTELARQDADLAMKGVDRMQEELGLAKLACRLRLRLLLSAGQLNEARSILDAARSKWPMEKWVTKFTRELADMG